MNIRIAAVGKLKEHYWRDAVSEYEKRLGRYCSIIIKEVPDERTPDCPSKRERELILSKEGERLLKQIPDESLCIALAIDGKRFDSEGLSDYLKQQMDHGISDITFVIGGSLGLSAEVLGRADLLLSFSDFTFPHQLMRVIALEQIYRSFRIMKYEPYHK